MTDFIVKYRQPTQGLTQKYFDTNVCIEIKATKAAAVSCARSLAVTACHAQPYPFNPTSYLTPMSQLFMPLPTKQYLAALGLFCISLVLPLSAHAQMSTELPAEMQNALAQAHLTANDISLIITPIGSPNEPANPTKPAQASLPHSQVTNSQLPKNQISKSRLPEAVIPVVIAPDAPLDSDGIPQPEPVALPVPAIDSSGQAANLTDNQTDLYLEDGSLVASEAGSVNNADLATAPLTMGIYHNPDTPRTPASTMKLIPTFIALDMLGHDFVWQTRVYYSGLWVGAELFGDLIIQGSGDPKMTQERLRELLYRVQQSGIRHIHGDIILDSSVFQGVTKDPAAFDNDPLRPYNASPDGFLVNFSSIEIHSYPDSEGNAHLIYSPKLADYKLPETIAQRSASCGDARRSLAPQWGRDGLRFAQALPSSCGEHTFYVAYPNAKDFAARVTAELWSQLGNTLTGRVRAQEAPVHARSLSPLPIASYSSEPLAQIIHDINHHSNNVMTEQLTLTLPVASSKAPPPTAYDSKVSAQRSAAPFSLYYQQGSSDYPLALGSIDQWWRDHLTTTPPHMTNGSGLCRDCRLTAANLAELLQFAYHHPEFDYYVDSLGIAGVSGTIKAHGERLPDSKAIGRAWIKTGTLNNVTSMAGYVKGLSGQDYVVVGIINTPETLDTYAARRLLDTMLDWTARH